MNLFANMGIERRTRIGILGMPNGVIYSCPNVSSTRSIGSEDDDYQLINRVVALVWCVFQVCGDLGC